MSGEKSALKTEAGGGSGSDVESSSFDDTLYSVTDQIAKEQGNEVQYRTCSWQKTAGLLFSEYICLAILSFPWSYSVLGLVPGILLTIAVAATVQYTSLVIWRFCLKHPEVRDVCDIGRILCGGSQWGYHFTAVMFILNNTFIQGPSASYPIAGRGSIISLKDYTAWLVQGSSTRFRILDGAPSVSGATLRSLLTSNHLMRFKSGVTAILCFVVSLPRTLNQLSGLGTFSAVTMAIAVLLAIVFAGIQSEPAGYIAGEPGIVTAWPVAGTTFVNGMSAFLNISYTLIGQITIPSFIAEMKEPKDFPKALWAVTICEIVVFSLCGSIMYHYVGNQYMTAPAFGALQPTYKKIAFSFAIPTIIYLGSLYSSVTARFLFFRIFQNSKHKHSNTLIGWATWASIIAVTWVFAFLIAELIPFFSDMLSLMSSLFDGWFGFIYWGMAYLLLHPGNTKWAGPLRSFETLVNYFLIVFGLFILVAGTYVSVQSIIDSYKAAAVGSVFTCVSNAL
ncbi:unnamed protein product [Mycena citricolor]|uniref:Amino acid transporter transmembrane domain-containing protein n=1 Tax=Mycena citricolor TaxID=2018698 RepID=A0AAD2HS21_9AGAR|nr:unnamed protein product [Mycena citricolor]